MKTLLVIAAVLSAPAFSHAQGPKACDDLKSEIAAKLDAKGVNSYSLEIVAKDEEVKEGKVVGACGGGTKKIVYHKTTTPPPTAAKDESKPS